MSQQQDDLIWKHYPFGAPDAAEREAAKRLAAERDAANSEMAVRFANLHMPEDIRVRAASWGMSAWAEVLWNSAFQAGYREAMRDRAPQEDRR
jgi:hypothetical protein